jgi:hypothetical protein
MKIIALFFVFNFLFAASFKLTDAENMAPEQAAILKKHIADFEKKLMSHFGVRKSRITDIELILDAEGYRFVEWGVGFYALKDKKIYLLQKRMRDWDAFLVVLRHEMVHAYADYFCADSLFWPLWFEEGLAQYLSGKNITFTDAQKLSTAIAGKNILEARELLRMPDTRFRVELYYLQSLFIVERLAAMNKLEEFMRIKDWSPQSQIPSPWRDWIDFEIWWQSLLQEEYRWFVLLNFNVIIPISFGIIFLIVYIIKLRENKKRLLDLSVQEEEQSGE